MVLSDKISFMAALSSLEAPTKLVPLSDSRVWGTPLLALNRRRAAMKAAVEVSDSNSMCHQRDRDKETGKGFLARGISSPMTSAEEWSS